MQECAGPLYVHCTIPGSTFDIIDIVDWNMYQDNFLPGGSKRY